MLSKLLCMHYEFHKLLFIALMCTLIFVLLKCQLTLLSWSLCLEKLDQEWLNNWYDQQNTDVYNVCFSWTQPLNKYFSLSEPYITNAIFRVFMKARDISIFCPKKGQCYSDIILQFHVLMLSIKHTSLIWLIYQTEWILFQNSRSYCKVNQRLTWRLI